MPKKSAMEMERDEYKAKYNKLVYENNQQAHRMVSQSSDVDRLNRLVDRLASTLENISKKIN